AREAFFTRKAGHTQRGGRPVYFDRFYAALLGGKAVDLLAEGHTNRVSTLQWTAKSGFFVDSYDANQFRDRWGLIHARPMHPSFFDATHLRPSPVGIEYLQQIFTNALGEADLEYVRQTAFAPGVLTHPYRSPNVDVAKRIRYLEA
nr:6-phosphofructokinase [Armatimonadota bacterium]